MAITIVSPKYSFVQFNNPLPVLCCDGDNEFSLPVIEEDDVLFQFSVVASTIVQATDIFNTPIANVHLKIKNSSGVVLRDWTSTDGLVFEKYRTGTKTVTYQWRNAFKDFKTLIACNECFIIEINANYTIANGAVNLTAESRPFIRKCDACYTTVLEYSNEEDYADFYYCNLINPVNRVRLPIFFSKPQYPDSETVYVYSDGRRKVLNSVTSKELIVDTEYFPEHIHEAIKIAISQDNKKAISNNYTGNFIKNGNYAIDWIDNLCKATASFKVITSPFNVRNNNCGTCTGSNFECPNIINLQSSTSASSNPNLVSFMFSFNPLPSSKVTGVTVRYRITGTPNYTEVISSSLNNFAIDLNPGTYDFIFAAQGNDCVPVFTPITQVVGSQVIPGSCGTPTNLQVTDVTLLQINVQWNRVLPIPANGYDWVLKTATNTTIAFQNGYNAPGNPVFLTVTDLNLSSNTEYIFSVRSHCDGNEYSSAITTNFLTP